MPFLTTNQYGAGPLYTFTPADPSAVLLANVFYYQTALFNRAITMGVANQSFTIAGSIGSRYIGISAEGSGTTNITVTATGYLAGDDRAINIYTDHTFNLINAGTIESTSGAVIYCVSTLAQITITNSGVIQTGGRNSDAIRTLLANDVVTNTGTIIGEVNLGGGNDRFDTYLGTFSGQVYGGTGDDVYIIKGIEDVAEYDEEGYDQVYSYGDYTLSRNVEALDLRGAARVAIGNSENNQIVGSGLDCTLSGLAGNDTISAGAGADTIFGGAGDDVIFADDGNNVISGGSGVDSIYAGVGDNVISGGRGNDEISVADGTSKLSGDAGDDVIGGGLGDDVINGGTGFDIASFGSNTVGMIGNLTTQKVSGGEASGDRIISIEGLYGSSFDDELSGSAGNDLLIGVQGNDTLHGLDGDDRLEGFSGADVLDGGIGNDTAEYIYSAVGVTVNLATGQGTSGDAIGDSYIAIENVTGGAQVDTLTGDGNANILRGGGGADVLNGAKGTDTLYGGAGNDTLVGGPDGDIFGFADIIEDIPGGWGSDTITVFQNGLDRISFVGASAITSIADVAVTADGADTLITAGLDVIRLLNFAPASVDASDFIFG